MGPLPFLAMLAWAVARTIRASRGWKRNQSSRFPAMIGAIGCALLLCTGIWSSVQAARRDDVDYIFRWSGTGGSRSRLARIAKRGDLASLRRLVQSDDEFEAGQAARELGKFGVPATDIPILHARFVQVENAPNSWTESYYTEALALLAGGKPAKETAARWEEYLRGRGLLPAVPSP